MLAKLIKIHGTDLSHLANETFEDIIIHIVDGISNWEEIDLNDYYKIINWINETNRLIKGFKYILVEKPDIPLKFCIKDQIERENKRLEEKKKKDENEQKRKESSKLEQQKKKQEKDRKKFEELKKMFGET